MPTTSVRALRLGTAAAIGAAAIIGAVLTRAQASCDTGLNAIVCENQRPGNPATEWDIDGAGDSTIQGFATSISVNKGETVRFKVDTTASTFQIDIYRLGYYQNNGARKIATLTGLAGIDQAPCLTNRTTGLIDCGNWIESASWPVPATAVSGIYIARLQRSDTGGASHVPFVVRDDAAQADLLFQTSDTTWQAYNQYGGNSLYVGGPGTNPGRAYKVSYNRPFTTRDTSPEDWLFNAEYPMVRWLEANGFNVSYTTGVDTDRTGATELPRHRVFMSVGHDEYWAGQQRANVEAARAAGVHLAFFSGNEMFWKTRWEPSIDGTSTAYRTLVCYKETHANAKIDPLQNVWTGTWRDPRFSPPADGGRPENAVTGTIFMVNCCNSNATITVSQAYASQPFWRNTRIATLKSGQSTSLTAGMLGYEWDENLANGFRPAGLAALSSTTMSVGSLLQDYGSTYGPGTATHQLTLYRHTSGALVFGAGTVQWSWGLDGNHDRGGSTPDLAVQQATVNLFADMGVQPQTLQPGLVPGAASGDTTPPTSAITAPSNGASFVTGSAVTISGTASDLGGGQVTAVQVSTDGGSTWQTATGTTSWTYAWTPGVTGTAVIRSRATDNGGNIETPSAGVTVTITSKACPCTIWNASATPSRIETSDTNAVELGVRFRADASGTVTGIRFYKGSGNTGTHIGSLWSSTGTLLASATFATETASGWQQVSFPSPVAIAANTAYIASYHTNTGQYGVDDGYFTAAGVDNAPLHAVVSSDSAPNGVYTYSASSAFPNQTYQGSNYWVDVVFNPASSGDATPPTVAITAPASAATVSGTGVAVTASASDNVGVAGVQFKLDGANLGVETSGPYSVTWDTTTAANGSHTLTAVARDAAGNTTTSAAVGVTVSNDTTPPTVAITAPAAGSTLSGAGVTVSASASDNVGVAGVQFKLDGVNLGAETTGPYAVTWNTTASANGSHTLTAVARDAAGNTTTSAAVGVIVSNSTGGDTTPPTVAITAPAAGATVSGTSVTVSAGASDNVGVAGVQFKLDGANLGAETTGPYAVTWNTTGSANGSHTLIAVARDAAGNVTTSAAVGVIVSNSSGGGTLAIDTVAFGEQSSKKTSVRTAAFSTAAGNELLLAFVSTDASSSGTNTAVTSVTGAGLTWQLVRRTNVQLGTSEIWRTFAPSPLSSVIVTAALSRSVAASITVVSVLGADPSGANGSGAIGATASANAGSGAPSAALTTTRNNSWVFAVGNDWDRAVARTPAAGQVIVHQYLASNGDTFWVQRTAAATPASGTLVTIADTAPTGDRYNLTLCEVLPAP